MIDPSIRRRHRLSTGVCVEHDVYEATRFPLFFATDLPGWPIASIGGTMFVLRYQDRLFAISARHILGDPHFEPASLIVHARNREPCGSKLTCLQAISLEIPQAERESGADDAFDLVVWEFEAPSTQEVQAYYWDRSTICEANPGGKLLVVGYLFDKATLSTLDENTGVAVAQVAKFGFYHMRRTGDDQSAMRGVAQYSLAETNAFGSFRGLSGAPVFDETSNTICGMVLRGGLDPQTGVARIFFLSALYIDRCLESLHRGDPKIDLAIQIF